MSYNNKIFKNLKAKVIFMYDKQLLLDRLGATFQKHVGKEFGFRTKRGSVITSISIDKTPFYLGKYYISNFQPSVMGSNFMEGCGEVLGYIKIGEMSNAIFVDINLTKLIERDVRIYVPFQTKILLDNNRIVLRDDKLTPSPLNLSFNEKEYSSRIVRPQEILPSRLFEQETYVTQ